MEELTAELGAAFVCAKLKLTNQPRMGHAQYAATWVRALRVRALRHDLQALFTAASRAQAAADWLHDRHVERVHAEGKLRNLGGHSPVQRCFAAGGIFPQIWKSKMFRFSPRELSQLQEALDEMGLVITLKEPTDAMLKRGWHCIDFDRPEHVTSTTEWTRPLPHKTSMKEDVRDAFVTMNEEAQAEIRRRLRPIYRKTLPVKRSGCAPPKPLP